MTLEKHAEHADSRFAEDSVTALRACVRAGRARDRAARERALDRSLARAATEPRARRAWLPRYAYACAAACVLVTGAVTAGLLSGRGAPESPASPGIEPVAGGGVRVLGALRSEEPARWTATAGVLRIEERTAGPVGRADGNRQSG